MPTLIQHRPRKGTANLLVLRLAARPDAGLRAYGAQEDVRKWHDELWKHIGSDSRFQKVPYVEKGQDRGEGVPSVRKGDLRDCGEDPLIQLVAQWSLLSMCSTNE